VSQPTSSFNPKDEDTVTDEFAPDLIDDADLNESDLTDDDDSAPPAVVPSTPIKIIVDRPIQTVGRRKEAVVRVRLTSGSGQFTLNGRTMDSYFPDKVHQQLIKEPLVTLDKAEAFDIHATLVGGGISGQAGALRLAIARALIDLDVNDRPPLKKAGFLRRDARIKERKKYGLKKARKAPQYSKR
jgi:small subunit ribosomal protein S9